MKYLYSFLFLIVVDSLHAQAPTTFILIRHAEKVNDDTRDPELSETGMARAQRLANVLQKNPIDAIYSTPYKRTRNTVMPLAIARNLSIREYDGSSMEQVDQMIGRHTGGTVLVVGHSNTIPAIANFLTGKNEYANFEDSDYNNLIIVTVFRQEKQAKVTWITY